MDPEVNNIEKMILPPNKDWVQQDNTDLRGELACVGGACEIV